MRQFIYFFLITAIVLGACTPSPDTPVYSGDPPSPVPVDYSPRASDDALTRTPVYLDEIDLLTLESYPLQFTLFMKGTLPTPCNQLRVATSPPGQDNRIEVQVYSVVKPDIMCAEVLQSFEIHVPLGSFPAGHYSILVNSQKVAEFDA